MSFHTGPGDDVIVLGLADESGNSVHFDGGVAINGGTGNDSLDALAPAKGNTGLGEDDLTSIETVL